MNEIQAISEFDKTETPSWKLRNIIRRIDRARRFPGNTCPCSRHTQMIGEALAKDGSYELLEDEPRHCAQSILITVEALYKARNKIEELEADKADLAFIAKEQEDAHVALKIEISELKQELAIEVATRRTAVKELKELQAHQQWQPIETAPKDGTCIDVWCVPPDDADFMPEDGGVRFCDVSWHQGDDVLPQSGWIQTLDDGNWDLIEGLPSSHLGYPAWVVTHWMPLPEPPEGES